MEFTTIAGETMIVKEAFGFHVQKQLYIIVQQPSYATEHT